MKGNITKCKQDISDIIYDCIHKAWEKGAFLSELININLPLGLDANDALIFHCDMSEAISTMEMCLFWRQIALQSHKSLCP